MKQLTKKQAVEFHDNKLYEKLSSNECAKFQMSQELVCMPFHVFHTAVQASLGRDVSTREFGFKHREGLKKELEEVLECTIDVHASFYSEDSHLN